MIVNTYFIRKGACFNIIIGELRTIITEFLKVLFSLDIGQLKFKIIASKNLTISVNVFPLLFEQVFAILYILCIRFCFNL